MEAPPPAFVRRLDEQSMAEMLAMVPAEETIEEASITPQYASYVPQDVSVPPAPSAVLSTPPSTAQPAVPLAPDLATTTSVIKPRVNSMIKPQMNPLPGLPCPSIGCALRAPLPAGEVERIDSGRLMLPCTLGIAPLDAAVSSLTLSADGRWLLVGDCVGALLLTSLEHSASQTSNGRSSAQGIVAAEAWRVGVAHRGGIVAACLSNSVRAEHGVAGPPAWAFSTGEDGRCAAWAAAGSAAGADGSVSPCMQWRLDCSTADRVYRDGESHAVVQLVACEPPAQGGVCGEDDKSRVADGEASCHVAVAVGASIFILEVRPRVCTPHVAPRLCTPVCAPSQMLPHMCTPHVHPPSGLPGSSRRAEKTAEGELLRHCPTVCAVQGLPLRKRLRRRARLRVLWSG